MSDYDSFGPNQLRHMEMIQAVIARLAGNSFLIKGWAITLTGAFLGFAVDRDDSDLAVAALLPIVVFWGLDTYYLRTERLFRALYNEVRKKRLVEPFFMSATDNAFKARAGRDASWLKAFTSGTLALFYLALLAAMGAVIWFVCERSETPAEALLLRAARLAYAIGDVIEIHLI